MRTLRQVIEDHHAEILEEWRQLAAGAVSARGLSRPELLNMLPRYVSSLARNEADLGRFTGATRELMENHLASRIRQGFEVAEVIEELAILGRVIAARCRALPAEDQPDPAVVQALFEELGLASTWIAEAFRRHLLDREQSEKRYVRLLQKIANEALERDAAPLRKRLDEVLVIFMEATGAESAALLLHDAETSELLLAAATGEAADLLERHIVNLDAAGAAAAHEQPVQFTHLEVPDEFTRNGIRALLGVRLPARRRLVGLLFLGMESPRHFTEQEIQRFETLAEGLSTHLENAKLYADLQARVATLQDERELRERFVTVLAHDLRGPLATARLSADVLARSVSGGEKEAADRVASSIDRIERMIADLLDADRIQAGQRLPLRIARCDLREITRRLVADLTAQHGARFVLEADEPVHGFWSADELRRAIENLCTNAVKYGENGVIEIRVERTSGRARIAVHNAGGPIPEADQKRLFDPRFRTLSARTGTARGWGLGLTLVRGTAEAHGGRVSVSSREEKGTTFAIEIPLDARPYQPASENDRPGSSPPS